MAKPPGERNLELSGGQVVRPLPPLGSPGPRQRHAVYLPSQVCIPRQNRSSGYFWSPGASESVVSRQASLLHPPL